MDMNVMGALTAYTYQSALTQTGSSSQALSQALASIQSQSADINSLVSNVQPIDPLASLAGGSGSQAFASLSYATSSAAGKGTEAVQSLLASLGGGSSALFSGSGGLPSSAAAQSLGATEAMVRYAYDQSKNPNSLVKEAVASGQQTLLTTGLNLLG